MLTFVSKWYEKRNVLLKWTSLLVTRLCYLITWPCSNVKLSCLVSFYKTISYWPLGALAELSPQRTLANCRFRCNYEPRFPRRSSQAPPSFVFGSCVGWSAIFLRSICENFDVFSVFLRRNLLRPFFLCVVCVSVISRSLVVRSRNLKLETRIFPGLILAVVIRMCVCFLCMWARASMLWNGGAYSFRQLSECYTE